jgi:DNA-binding GntR family transcriptional regulator
MNRDHLVPGASRWPEAARRPPRRPSGLSDGARDGDIARIRALFLRAREMGQPKHLQLRKALLMTIRGGVLAAGHQVPPERDLAHGLGLSLGTVRRTLDQLALEGTLSRDHGRGTFVTSAPRAISDSWHFRFWDEANPDRLLPVYSYVLHRGVVRARGTWSRHLGSDTRGYVRIDRRFDVDDRFRCYSEFYLRASRFGAVAELPIEDLEGVNLKTLLGERFGIPTLCVSQRVRAERLSTKVCGVISVKPRNWGFFLEVVGYSLRNTPISYHAIWVPASSHMMDLTVHRLYSALDLDPDVPATAFFPSASEVAHGSDR